MNIYKTLNQIVAYIESHLTEQIEYDDLAKFMGTTSYTMQKIFTLLTNISLSEYIRNRRLSCAGFDLYQKKQKIIDLAVKYQYQNATSFSRAFEKFHQIKPSKVTEKTKLVNFPQLSFNENIPPINNITYYIITQEELTLYGKGIETTTAKIKKDAPLFLEKVKNQYSEEFNYAMTKYKDITRENSCTYSILYKKKLLGLTKTIIPKSKWLVFHISSQEAKDIQDTIDTFYQQFLPSCNYHLKDLPELEYYHDNETDFLIAIE